MELFNRFANDIMNLRGPGVQPDELSRFLLESHRDVSIYYAPFDWINTNARIIIVGITTGRDSMDAGFAAARSVFLDNGSSVEAAIAAKRTGSFPHASGANGHLGSIWRNERDQLRARVERWATY